MPDLDTFIASLLPKQTSSSTAIQPKEKENSKRTRQISSDHVLSTPKKAVTRNQIRIVLDTNGRLILNSIQNTAFPHSPILTYDLSKDGQRGFFSTPSSVYLFNTKTGNILWEYPFSETGACQFSTDSKTLVIKTKTFLIKADTHTGFPQGLSKL